ncbi:hypothetical protein GW924_00320 [Candidatus Pacearchaeota archaeon]|nr:hypothetical protein [Candidatus Pacearchaeota archaeon]
MGNLFKEQLDRNHQMYTAGYQGHGQIIEIRNSFVQAARGRMPQEEFDLTLAQIGAEILQVRDGLQDLAAKGRMLAYYKSTREGRK